MPGFMANCISAGLSSAPLGLYNDLKSYSTQGGMMTDLHGFTLLRDEQV